MYWQLLGIEKEMSLRQRRGSERKGGDCQRQCWCSLRLRLGLVCCHCASVIAGGQVCQDRAAFPQRPQSLCWNAPEKTQAQDREQWMDADPLPLLHLLHSLNSKAVSLLCFFLSTMTEAFQAAEHKISVNSLVKTNRQVLNELVPFIRPLNLGPQVHEAGWCQALNQKSC